MKTYIGTKLVRSESMNRLDYNTFRGWKLPADENGADEGYLVEYLDGGKPNTSTHTGYVSWSPKEQHEAAYREISEMSFGLAVEALKKGMEVTRAGWNDKAMRLALIKDDMWDIGGTAPYDMPDGAHIDHAPFIGMRTADLKFVPWLASQTDVLAEDWAIL